MADYFSQKLRERHLARQKAGVWNPSPQPAKIKTTYTGTANVFAGVKNITPVVRSHTPVKSNYVSRLGDFIKPPTQFKPEPQKPKLNALAGLKSPGSRVDAFAGLNQKITPPQPVKEPSLMEKIKSIPKEASNFVSDVKKYVTPSNLMEATRETLGDLTPQEKVEKNKLEEKGLKNMSAIDKLKFLSGDTSKSKLLSEEEKSKYQELNKKLSHYQTSAVAGFTGGVEDVAIKNAVIKYGGKIYKGASHAEAIAKAPQEAQEFLMKNKFALGKFETSDGRLISRQEAQKEFGITHSQEVPELAKRQETKKNIVPQSDLKPSKTESNTNIAETNKEPVTTQYSAKESKPLDITPAKVSSFEKPVGVPKETPKINQHKLEMKNNISEISKKKTGKITETGVEAVRNMSTFRKWFTGGEKILKRSGVGGKRLAETIKKQRLSEDLTRGRYNNTINNALNGLSKKERINVGESLEGLSTPKSPKEVRAKNILKKMLDDIGTKAEQDKFEIRIPSEKGNKSVPFTKRENYFPRSYDFDKIAKGKKREEMIQHLVDTGQSRNKAEAERVFDNYILSNTQRRAGNLENARILDLPGYEKDPIIALKKYVGSISRRFTEAEHFGKKDEIAAEYINQIANQGGDYREAQRIFDFTTKGIPKNKVVSAIMQANMVTKLSLSAIANATQSINTMTKGNILDVTKAMFKALTKEGKEIRDLSGVLDDFIYIKESALNPNKLIRAVMYPFQKVEDYNRTVSAITGKLTAERLYGKLKLNQNNKYVLRQLESLGLDSKKLLTEGLTENDLYTAANKMTEITQFKVDPIDVPPSWKTPIGRLVSQFKSFSFMQTKLVRDEIINEARNGNFAPAIKFIVLAPIASYLANKIRNVITGRDEKDETKNVDIRQWDKWLKAAGTVPTDLISQGKFLYDSYQSDYLTPLKKGARTVGTVFGPTASEVGNLVSGVETIPDTQKRNIEYRASISKGKSKELDPYLDLKRQAVEKIPFAGQYLKNKYFAYPKSDKNEEEKQKTKDFYGMVSELQKLPYGSDESKNKVQGYINSLNNDEERKKQKYILEQNGISTKGIRASDTTIRAQELYDKAKSMEPDKANELYDQLKENEPNVAKYFKQYALEDKMTDEEKNLKGMKTKERADKLYEELKAMKPEDANAKVDEYSEKGITTPQVIKELENKIRLEKYGGDVNKALLDEKPKSRAKSVYDMIMQMPQPERNPKLNELIDNGVVDGETLDEIIFLKENTTKKKVGAGEATTKQPMEFMKTMDVQDAILNTVPEAGIIAGYNITDYATAPTHELDVGTIYFDMPDISTTKEIDKYINETVGDSPITGDMIVKAANKYDVDPKMVMSIIQKDSSFGTAGKAVRTKNAGNWGNDDSGNLVYMKDWQDGLNKVAKWLKKHEI